MNASWTGSEISSLKNLNPFYIENGGIEKNIKIFA